MWSSYTAFNPSVLSFVISDLLSLQKENTFLEIVNFIYIVLKKSRGNSLAVQWLGLRASNAGGMGSIPGQGTRSHMPQGVDK